MKCECSDPGCQAHPGESECKRGARALLLRIDINDSDGTAMCRECASDALDSGLFREVPLVRRYPKRINYRRMPNA